MYSYIKGQITEIMPTHITVENNGIGYLIKVANPYAYDQYLNKETITIYTHYNVREDAIELYGFSSLEEKQIFLNLISVKGLGPKGALAILASSTPSELTKAINSSDDRYFTRFPGIGNKLSQQIILDLKGRINFEDNQIAPKDERLDNVETALKALGYSNTEIKQVTKKLIVTPNITVNELVKNALKLLSKAK